MALTCKMRVLDQIVGPSACSVPQKRATAPPIAHCGKFENVTSFVQPKDKEDGEMSFSGMQALVVEFQRVAGRFLFLPQALDSIRFTDRVHAEMEDLGSARSAISAPSSGKRDH